MADMLTKEIGVAFIKMKPTSTGKTRWNLKDDKENWYSVWEEAVAQQLIDAQGNNYRVNIGYTQKGDFANVQTVAPAGVSRENFEEDILAEFKPEAPQAPAPKPLNAELATIVDERKHAIYCASTFFAGKNTTPEKLIGYADLVLKYIRGEEVLNTKITQLKKEDLDEADYIG